MTLRPFGSCLSCGSFHCLFCRTNHCDKENCLTCFQTASWESHKTCTGKCCPVFKNSPWGLRLSSYPCILTFRLSFLTCSLPPVLTLRSGLPCSLLPSSTALRSDPPMYLPFTPYLTAVFLINFLTKLLVLS